jgi:hypothetical protein
MELIYILLILNIVTLIVLFHHIYNCSCSTNTVEGLETVDIQNDAEITGTEGIKNIASLYQGKRLIVDDLMVTGDLQVQGDAGFGENVQVDGDTKFGKNVTITGNPGAQNKITIYSNGDGKVPFFYANRDGVLGYWNNANKWAFDKNGYLTAGTTADILNGLNNSAVKKNASYKLDILDGATWNRVGPAYVGGATGLLRGAPNSTAATYRLK